MLTSLVKALVEDSYSSGDIPRFFRVVFDFGDNYNAAESELVAANLAKRELPGLKGISSSAGITMQFLGVARNALLVMPAKELLELNKVTRIMYDNPRYLFSKDMLALRRIYSSPEGPSGFRHALQNLFDYGLREAKMGRVKGDWRDLVHRMESGQDLAFHFSKNMVTVNKPEDLAEWLVKQIPILKATKKSWGNPYEVAEQYTRSDWTNFLVAAAKAAGEIYKSESEWVVKGKSLKVPEKSRLYLMVGEDTQAVPQEMLDLYDKDPKNIRLSMGGWKSRIERERFRRDLVDRYKLDSVYKLTWLSGAKFKAMRDAHFRSRKVESIVEGMDSLLKYWKKRLKDVKHPWEHLHQWALKHPDDITGDPKAWAAWMHKQVYGMTPIERKKKLEKLSKRKVVRKK